MERQQGHDDGLNKARDDVAEVDTGSLQRVARNGGQPQPDNEGEQQRSHNIHRRRHGHREVRRQHGRLGVLHGLERLRADGQYVRKDGRAGQVSEEAREDGGAVGNERRDEQQPACSLAQLADGWRHEAKDDERDGKREEVAKEGIERDKESDYGGRQELSE